MADLEAVIATTFTKDKEVLKARFAESLDRLTADALQTYRLKYLLAKLTQHVDLTAYGDIEKHRWLQGYYDYEIEHVYPQNPSARTAAEFGSRSAPNLAQRLGNLVLVEKSINASLGNRPYSEKSQVYTKSNLLLTRALSETPKVGAKTKIDRAVAGLAPFSSWNAAAIAKRQRQLVHLCCTIWGVPEFPLPPI
jgi:Protein of unknown function (DUF1524)